MELKEMIGMEGVQGIAVGLGEELLDNLLLPCVNTHQGKAVPIRCRGRRRKAHIPYCSNMQGQAQKSVLLCYLVTVVAWELY